ncbi:MAG: nucleotidyltransferase domain-containing protein [Nitrolancea sp.]
MIQAKQDELAQLCRKFQIRRLELFGSASRDDFDPHSSDLDFLVEFEDMPPADFSDAYFGMLASLEELFGRNVDLVSTAAVRNPYFLEAIEHSRSILYAA